MKSIGSICGNIQLSCSEQMGENSMIDIVQKSIVLIFVIVLGYLLKKIGLFSRKNDFSTISKLVLYVTLPSAIITNLNGLRFPTYLLVISVFGFLCNWFYILLSKLFGKTNEEKGFMALNINGYNIGNFALPFIAYFLEGLPILAISLFDAGNSVMVLGGNYAVAKNFKEGDAQFDFRSLLKSIVKSPTIVVYFIMVSLSLLSLDLPSFVIDVAQIVGSANTFLAMFLIGVALEFNFETEYLKKISKYLSLRYIPAILLSIVVMWVPFFAPEVKLGLSTLVLAPVAGSAPIFTDQLNSDLELSGQVNSVSIILSILMITTYLSVLGL